MALGEIPLVPEEAAVGLDIRVVGNDSGEKVRELILHQTFMHAKLTVN
jgi:hypothetical protein